MNLDRVLPGLEEIVCRNLGTGFLKFTTDIDEVIRHSLVIFIAVGTPPRPDGSADLSCADEVSQAVARNLSGHYLAAVKLHFSAVARLEIASLFLPTTWETG